MSEREAVAPAETTSSVGAVESPAAVVPAPGPSRRALLILGGVVLLLALATRFARLGERPLHHDESIHAFQSYSLAKDGNWRYDPAYHGPFLYYANALVYKIVGVTDTTARLLPAIFGLILMAFAWPLARWIGRSAAAAFALLVLISPHLTYFSRFIREDLYSLVFTLGTIVCFRMFLETDRARWLTLSAVSFALAGVTKENAYMTGVLFVVFGLWKLAERAAEGKRPAAGLAVAVADAYQWSRARWKPLATAALVFLSIWALMYSAFGKYPGDWLAIPKAVKYWMGQHAIARIPGPWYYYFPQLAYYETGFLFAIPFAFVAGRRRDPFFRFLVFWVVGSLAIYSWAREKVPWLTVHPLLPLTILASVGLANLWRERRSRRLAFVAVFVLLGLNASAMVLACFRYGAYDLKREPKHGEYLAYVQTTYDLIRALAAVDRAMGRVPSGQPLITVAGEASWPLTWYLRDTPTTWTSRITEATTPILVTDWNPENGLEKQLADRYDAQRIPIRAWWFPERKPAGPDTPMARPTLSDFTRWWLLHELWSPIGSQDAIFFVRKDLAGTGPLAPLQIAVQDTSAREYRDPAEPLAPDRAWGESGPAPGQFAEPRGVAADARGNLYVADSKNHRIQAFDGTGKFLRAFGSRGTGDGQLNEPNGVAVDENGDVWVADTWNNRIAHFGPDGQFRGAFGDPDKTFFGPRGIVVSRGALYISDTGNKRIVRFDRAGKRQAEWGSDGNRPGQFVEPVGLAADASGKIYVADTGNHRVQVFDADGKFIREFRVFGWKDFYTEPHLAVGPSDSVLVTDSWGARCALYDANGNLTRAWTTDGLRAPTGIVLDPFGRLYVSDRGANRVLTWSLVNVMR